MLHNVSTKYQQQIIFLFLVNFLCGQGTEYYFTAKFMKVKTHRIKTIECIFFLFNHPPLHFVLPDVTNLC